LQGGDDPLLVESAVADCVALSQFHGGPDELRGIRLLDRGERRRSDLHQPIDHAGARQFAEPAAAAGESRGLDGGVHPRVADGR
jgi:hypothetical protein